VGGNLSLDNPSILAYHSIIVSQPITNWPNNITLNLLEDVMRRRYRKVPIFSLHGAYATLEVFSSLYPLALKEKA
jgi:hypothetical protein